MSSRGRTALVALIVAAIGVRVSASQPLSPTMARIAHDPGMALMQADDGWTVAGSLGGASAQGLRDLPLAAFAWISTELVPVLRVLMYIRSALPSPVQSCITHVPSWSSILKAVVMGEISFEKRDSLLAPCTSIFPLPVFFVLMCTRSWNPSPFKSARVQTPSSSREKTVGIGLAAKSLLRRCKAVGEVSIPSWSSCSILLMEVLRSSNRAALSSLR